MTNERAAAVNYCYRHPDRQSFVLCQRCGRTVCPQCQTQAAVGVHCPECVREARASMPRRRPTLRALRSSSGTPVVTWAIIALTVIVFVLQNIPGSPVNSYGVYRPVLTLVEPWTMITALFLHASVIHILFNMYTLYVLGPPLEGMLGRAKFIGLYLISGFGGSVAVLLLSPGVGVLGASGATFGLMGAFFIIQRRFGGNNAQILIVIVINLAMGFLVSGISWQAHVGGLAAGCAVAAIFLQTRKAAQQSSQILMMVALVAILLFVTIARAMSL